MFKCMRTRYRSTNLQLQNTYYCDIKLGACAVYYWQRAGQVLLCEILHYELPGKPTRSHVTLLHQHIGRETTLLCLYIEFIKNLSIPYLVTLI